MQHTLQALIFDVDGTLADTERDGHRLAFNQAFAEQGLTWEWSVATYGELLAVTGGKERIRHYMQAYLQRSDADSDGGTFIKTLHQRKTEHYLALLQAGRIPLRPGVAALLDEAEAAGLTLAIATTTTPENVTYLLKATLGEHGPERFAVIAAGDVVPAKKPAPDIYHYALERLGLAPQACVAIEDSANGVRAARAAGLATVVVTNDYTRAQDFSGALAVFDSFVETGTQADEPGRALDWAALRRLWHA